jgi:predicted Fe-Mo cluster-binding NifX family protein
VTQNETKVLRIAVPSELPGGLAASRSGHFGRCACYTIVDIAGGEVAGTEVLENAPHAEGGCLAPVMTLAEHLVNAIVVDGIGGRPLAGFNQIGIAVHRGIGDDVGTAVSAYLSGALPVVSFEGACSH